MRLDKCTVSNHMSLTLFFFVLYTCIHPFINKRDGRSVRCCTNCYRCILPLLFSLQACVYMLRMHYLPPFIRSNQVYMKCDCNAVTDTNRIHSHHHCFVCIYRSKCIMQFDLSIITNQMTIHIIMPSMFTVVSWLPVPLV